MQVVHDYGRGHQSPPFPASDALPDETDEKYSAHITSFFVQGDFAQLEKIAQQNRKEKGRLIGGVWKTNAFFNAVSFPVHTGELKDSDYQLQIATVKKWVAAYPDSATPRIALASTYSNYGSFARGTGYANTVSNSQWKIYRASTARAKQALLEAAQLKDRDPQWYELMQGVAHDEGWDKDHAHDLLEQAVAFQPGYYHYYRLYSTYLLPQWYGEIGDIQAFAEQTAAHHPEPESSMFYFDIISTLACYCKQDLEDLPKTSWPTLKQGYAGIQQHYGISDLEANRFAFMAYIFKDKAAAHEAFDSVVTYKPDIWYSKDVFANARDWASSP